MKPDINISRETLAELLRAAGSPLTPEQYLASLEKGNVYARYPGRAKAATWSKNILCVAVVLGGVILIFDRSLEGVILLAALATITFFEYRVHRYFRDWNPKAPTLGFRNQTAFAALILIYGLYHAFFPQQLQVPDEYREVMDPAMTGMIQTLAHVFYLVIGIVGGLSQFGLAWYYRRARISAKS